MSHGYSIYCKDTTSVATALAGVPPPPLPPEAGLDQIGPTEAEQVSARAGENASVLGGK